MSAPMRTSELPVERSLNSHHLSPHESVAIAAAFKVLGDPTRLRLLSLVASDSSMSSAQLEEILEISQPTVSHHLKKLHEVGLIHRYQQGRRVRYTISDEQFAHLARLLMP